jgi:hypothetical protein
MDDAVTIRRARLVDVPAVARLLGAPRPEQWRSRAGVSARTITSATRLLLTHVGLEYGEFWVAAGRGQIRGAVVLLPPANGDVQSRLHATLRLELGLPASALPDSPLRDGPEGCWLLLAAPVPAGVATFGALLRAVLARVDAEGLPVLSIQPGLPAGVLAEAGFHQIPVSGSVGSAGGDADPAAQPHPDPVHLRPARTAVPI